MKTYKMIFAAIGMAAWLMMSQSLNAQTAPTDPWGVSSTSVPDSLPVTMDDIQTSAWEAVASVGVYGGSSSSINATTNDQAQVNVPYSPAAGVVDIDEVFALVRAQRLRISTLYPTTDSVSLGASLFDKKGNGIFYSDWQSHKIGPFQNSVSEVGLMFNVVLNMSDYVWINALSNAVGFRIVERDATGDPTLFYYSPEYGVQNGMILFPVYFADKIGEIVIQLADGTEVAYGLNGGKKITPTTVLAYINNISALGMRTFRDTNSVYVVVSWEEYSNNINPLSQLVTVDNGKGGAGGYNFAAWIIGDPNQRGGAPILGYASSVRIWRQGQPSSTAENYNIVEAAKYTVSPYLTPGRYWVKFAFKGGWPFGNQFQPPYQDNGGMGGGEGK